MSCSIPGRFWKRSFMGTLIPALRIAVVIWMAIILVDKKVQDPVEECTMKVLVLVREQIGVYPTTAEDRMSGRRI